MSGTFEIYEIRGDWFARGQDGWILYGPGTEASCSGNVCPPSNPAGFIHLEPKGIRHRPTNRERLGTEEGARAAVRRKTEIDPEPPSDSARIGPCRPGVSFGETKDLPPLVEDWSRALCSAFGDDPDIECAAPWTGPWAPESGPRRWWWIGRALFLREATKGRSF